MSVNHCEWQAQNQIAVVTVTGEVDLSWSQEVRRAVLDAVGSGKPVAVDLSGVSYIDSSGIAALVEGFQLARGHTQGFALVQSSRAVKAVLELARLDKVFALHDSVEAFLQTQSKSP